MKLSPSHTAFKDVDRSPPGDKLRESAALGKMALANVGAAATALFAEAALSFLPSLALRTRTSPAEAKAREHNLAQAGFTAATSQLEKLPNTSGPRREALARQVVKNLEALATHAGSLSGEQLIALQKASAGADAGPAVQSATRDVAFAWAKLHGTVVAGSLELGSADPRFMLGVSFVVNGKSLSLMDALPEWHDQCVSVLVRQGDQTHGVASGYLAKEKSELLIGPRVESDDGTRRVNGSPLWFDFVSTQDPEPGLRFEGPVQIALVPKDPYSAPI